MAVVGAARVGRAIGNAQLPNLRRAAAVACGWTVAVALVLSAGELYLRVAPPGDLAEYLGAESPRAGPFRPDPRYGAQYRSLDALLADNPGRMEPYLQFLHNPRTPKFWAFFGNSFAQAPGMLADTAREHVRTRLVFNLGKNEILPVRLAQAEFLLDAGFPVERLFVVLLPIDGHWLSQRGPDQIRVTAGGGIAYEPRVPEAGRPLVRNSRLALQGWTQTGLHVNEPFYLMREVNTRFDGRMLADLTRMFAEFAKGAARHRVPVTVVLIPNYEQVVELTGCAFQDAVAPALRELGYDVCDVRRVFRGYPAEGKAGLFIPDKHFSPTGNRLLLATVIGHLKTADPAADLPDPRTVLP